MLFSSLPWTVYNYFNILKFSNQKCQGKSWLQGQCHGDIIWDWVDNSIPLKTLILLLAYWNSVLILETILVYQTLKAFPSSWSMNKGQVSPAGTSDDKQVIWILSWSCYLLISSDYAFASSFLICSCPSVCILAFRYWIPSFTELHICSSLLFWLLVRQ